MSTAATNINDGQNDWSDDQLPSHFRAPSHGDAGCESGYELADAAGGELGREPDLEEFGDSFGEAGYLVIPESDLFETETEMVLDAAALRDCTDSLTPLIERAAITCESLRESCRIAEPSEKAMRETLGEVATLLDRAEVLLPTLARGVESVQVVSDPSPSAEVRELVYDAIASMRQELDDRSRAERQRIDRLESELNDRVAALGERVEIASSLTLFAGRVEQEGDVEIGAKIGADGDSDINSFEQRERPEAQRTLIEAIVGAPVVDRDAVDAVIEQAIGEGVTRTLALWERETVQLMDLFRARVERAISSVETAAADRARQLDDLCGKADKVFALAGGDPDSLTNVVGELVESMRPWRGLLVEGKCGPDLAPLVQTIVERVRADVRGELVGRLDELDATVSKVAARAVTTLIATESIDQGNALQGSSAIGVIDARPVAVVTSVRHLRVGPAGISSTSSKPAARSTKPANLVRVEEKDGARATPREGTAAKTPPRTTKATKRRAA